MRSSARLTGSRRPRSGSTRLQRDVERLELRSPLVGTRGRRGSESRALRRSLRRSARRVHDGTEPRSARRRPGDRARRGRGRRPRSRACAFTQPTTWVSCVAATSASMTAFQPNEEPIRCPLLEGGATSRTPNGRQERCERFRSRLRIPLKSSSLMMCQSAGAVMRADPATECSLTATRACRLIGSPRLPEQGGTCSGCCPARARTHRRSRCGA